jgi:hypothetical protein
MFKRKHESQEEIPFRVRYLEKERRFNFWFGVVKVLWVLYLFVRFHEILVLIHQGSLP